MINYDIFCSRLFYCCTKKVKFWRFGIYSFVFSATTQWSSDSWPPNGAGFVYLVLWFAATNEALYFSTITLLLDCLCVIVVVFFGLMASYRNTLL